MRSKTTFVDVSFTIVRASKIGTPELINVPNVLVVRATTVFSMMPPMTGILSFTQSMMKAPVRCSRISFKSNHQVIGKIGKRYQYFTNHSDVAIRASVAQGSCSLKSRKIFLNLGMIKIMMKVKMLTATRMTTAGY